MTLRRDSDDASKERAMATAQHPYNEVIAAEARTAARQSRTSAAIQFSTHAFYYEKHNRIAVCLPALPGFNRDDCFVGEGLCQDSTAMTLRRNRDDCYEGNERIILSKLPK